MDPTCWNIEEEEAYLDEDNIPIEKLDGLKNLVNNSVEDWPELHYRIIEHNLNKTITNTTQFSNNAMVVYFTNRPPLLQDFKIWVREELERKSGWPINRVQYLGKNFSLIEFDDPADRNNALDFSPWFYGRKFLYTFPWVPNFDLTIRNYNMLPV